MTTNYFTKDYLTYDNYGLAEIRCMACNIPIKTRMEEPSKINPSRFVYVLGKHANYREIPVLLSDNSISFVMVCSDMENLPITEKEAPLISHQICNAKRMELEYEGRPNDLIEVVLNNMIAKKRVLRRLTPQEIKERFGGNN